MQSFWRLHAWTLVLLSGAALHAQTANYPYILKHIAGTLTIGDGGPATAAYLLSPNSAVLDAAGNLYVLDSGHGSIRKVTTDGKINTLVSGLPTGIDVKLGGDGNFYIAGSGQVLKVTPAGVSTVIAGNGTPGFGGDGGPAASAQVGQLGSLALDSAGDIFLADYGNNRVREITPNGIIQTIAGNGNSAFAGDGGPATAAQLNPYGIAVDSTGVVYVSDDANRRIRKFTPGGTIQTIAGNGTTGNEKDGPALASPFNAPNGLALDSSNNLYFSDNAGTYSPVYELSATDGSVKHIAGALTGYNLTDDAALSAVFQNANHIMFDPTGTTLYFADRLSNLVRKLGSDGIVHTVAGAIHFGGNGGPATAALLNDPYEILLDPQGDLLVADVNNYFIRKITPDGNINAFAGTGAPGYPDDGTPIGTGPIYRVRGMVEDSAGNIDLALNEKVEKISAAGTYLAVAGTGNGGNGSDGGPALQTTFGSVAGIAIDQTGNLYVGDFTYNRVRKISTAGTITNYAGASNGTSGFAGDGGPAVSAKFDFVDSLYNNFIPMVVDPQGDLYITDIANNRIRMVNAAGTISTVVGNGTAGHPVDGQPAVQTPFSAAGGIALDAAGNLYVSSYVYGEIYAVSGGAIRRIGGGGTQPPADGMDARNAYYIGGAGLAAGPNGDLYSSNALDQIWKLVLNSPAGLTITGGNNQSGAVGSTLPAVLGVAVNGRAGVGVAGATVTFAVTSGSAILSASSVTTGTAGTATVNVTLGPTAGNIVVTASVAGTTVASVTFSITATSGGGTGPGCSVGLPAVTSVKSLTDFGAFSTFTAGSYLEIKGSNLAVDTRIWAGSDFNGSNAPTMLDGTSVSINAVPGFVYYISPTQIDVQAPADPATGSVPLIVTNCAGSSTAIQVQKASLAPGMLAPASFNIGGKQYLVALFQDGVTYVGNVGLIAGVPFRPAMPGDLITTYGVGFGSVTPASPPGVVVAQANSIPNLTISFGSTAATVSYAGLAVGVIGLYQFNLAVPQVAAGDYQINVSVGSTQVQQTLYLTVGQ
jgi:uncharacterized protein (TIGR03437 family)